MITHVVCFKLKERTPDNTQKVKDALMSLEGKVPTLQRIEVGIDVLRSERSYDVILISNFASMADLDAYQVHPYHQEVAAFIRSVSEGSISVDYES